VRRLLLRRVRISQGGTGCRLLLEIFATGNVKNGMLLVITTLSVGITFDAQTYTYQCDAEFPNITWNGYHNVVETETSACDSDALSQWFPYYTSGHTEAYPSSAKPLPGSCRYFKCSLHCSPTTSRFVVCCDPSPSPLSPPPLSTSPVSPPPLSPPRSTPTRTIVVASISVGTLLIASACCWFSIRRFHEE